MPMWLAIVFALVCGALTALQSRINGQLAHAIDDPYTAAAISFGSGLAILLVVLAAWRPGRRGLGRVVTAPCASAASRGGWCSADSPVRGS